ncbi:putative calcium-binding protein CML36 [Tasmannia lanceolata]|uniref:putative calcium-binding protein CML36 n=1 Tax=Tasmannia lanceolata TaxID=3420 RepID=UPI00406350AA
MKLNLRSLFGSKKSRSMSKSDPSYFSSISSTSSKETPKSVLHPKLNISGDFSDFSADISYDVIEVFKLFDKDGDGNISRHELELVFQRLGAEPPSDKELGLILDDADQDGDGSISLEEFGALYSALGPVCRSELLDAFNYFDTDRDGKISAEELFGVFSTLGDDRCTLEECRRMIEGVDTDGDGFVCFEDFARMMEIRG